MKAIEPPGEQPLPGKSSLTRRTIIETAIKAGGLALAPYARTANAESTLTDSIVETASGKVRGKSRLGVSSFLGIPYGGAVSGPSRWRPASKPDPWPGVRDALHYGPRSRQSDADIPNIIAPDVWEVFTRKSPLGPASMPQDENCLVLNIWTPALRGNHKSPVMFWCHGGGFFMQAPPIWWNDGTSLARNHDVVVVTVNHRLGALGFLHLAELAGEEHKHAGNAGLLDLILALQWVQENIGEFGGDPQNVTIFGESGGGAKVATLLAMPGAQGLFHKAAIQSGPSLRARTAEQANATLGAFLKHLGLFGNHPEDLAKVPAEAVLKAQSAVYAESHWTDMDAFSPVVDGYDLPNHPFDPGAPSISKHVPLIIGTNATETTVLASKIPDVYSLDDTRLRRLIGANAGAATDRLIAGYRREMPNASPSDLFFAISTDRGMRQDSIVLAQRKAGQSGAPVYMYLLRYQTNVLGGKLRSPHSLELPFVFDNPDLAITGTGRGRFELARQMSGAWATFAHTGNPNCAAIPQWKPYAADERATMVFDTKSAMVDNPGITAESPL
jgi:para-nitrobenzyl esterase